MDLNASTMVTGSTARDSAASAMTTLGVYTAMRDSATTDTAASTTVETALSAMTEDVTSMMVAGPTVAVANIGGAATRRATERPRAEAGPTLVAVDLMAVASPTAETDPTETGDLITAAAAIPMAAESRMGLADPTETADLITAAAAIPMAAGRTGLADPTETA